MSDYMSEWRWQIITDEWNEASTTGKARILKGYFGITIEPHGRALRFTLDEVSGPHGGKFPLTRWASLDYHENKYRPSMGFTDPGSRERGVALLIEQHRGQCHLVFFIREIQQQISVNLPGAMYDGIKEIIDAARTLSALQPA